MKSLLTAVFLVAFCQLESSAFLGDVVSKVKDMMHSSEEVRENNFNNTYEYLPPNRTGQICSFVTLEKPPVENPDPESCKKINEKFKENDNFDFINYFGEMFNFLKTGIDSIKFPNTTTEKNKIIFFVGNTGSGKSTLVQILGADNSKIFSKRPHEDSPEFIIEDYSKIGVDTVTSQTLYPELLVDKETGYVLVDNPGFRDTRSPVHEIIATFGMRKVLQHTGKVKIVIVTTHASVKTGMYRDDFPNLLKHLTDFFYDMEKYKTSIYLIGTKAENTFSFVKGVPKIAPDSSLISGTAHFLTEVKKSLSKKNHDFNITTENSELFVDKSIKIINSLTQNNNGNYNRIAILRRPAEEGPLSEISMIQEERTKIRSMLLNEENMSEVKQGDFGFPLTESAELYLNELFEKMNSYIIKLSEIISLYMMDHYKNIIDSNKDINDVINFIRETKIMTNQFSHEIGESSNPGKYADFISSFSDENKLKLDCLTTFKNISSLNEYLMNLEDLSDSTKYTPLAWNMSMKRILEFIDNKQEQYNLLSDVYKLSSTHKFQRKRSVKPSDRENTETAVIMNENDFFKYLDEYNLKTRYELISVEDKLLENVNEILHIALKHNKEYECNNGTLKIVDYYLLFSELEEIYFEECTNLNKIVLIGIHTVFIDADLTSDVLKGKDLTIIAPIWEVVGTRTISVDGLSGGPKLGKAGPGVIGNYGQNGKMGGTFAGIGKTFINGDNLKISACGGNGQDGQDGGDGVDGVSGSNGIDQNAQQEDSKKKIFIVMNFVENTYVAKGSAGGSGGDAGGGGLGGYGGMKGSAVIHNIGNEPHQINVVVEDGETGKDGIDGKPGKGGIRGCDKEIKETTTYLLFIPISTSKDTDFVCRAQNPNGSVQKSGLGPVRNNNDITRNDSPVCVHIMYYQNWYLDNYHSFLSDGVSRQFLIDMKQQKY